MAASRDEGFSDWLAAAMAGLSQAQQGFLQRMIPAFTAMPEAGLAAARMAAASAESDTRSPEFHEAYDTLISALQRVFPGGLGGGFTAPGPPPLAGPLPFVLGPGQEAMNHWRALEAARQRYEEALQRYGEVCVRFAPEVVRRFAEEAAAGPPPGEGGVSQSLARLLELGDEVYAELSAGEEYRRAAAELINSGVGLVKALRDSWDEACAALDLPSRAELAALRAENARLAARLEALEAGAAQRAAEPVARASDSPPDPPPQAASAAVQASRAPGGAEQKKPARPAARRARAGVRRASSQREEWSIDALTDAPGEGG